MRKQILSVCLSLTLLAASGSVYGMQARASETAAEGASVIEAVPAETEFAAPQEVDDSVATDAAGNVIAPEVAQAIDSADMGVTDMEKLADPEQAASDIADGAEETLQAPEDANGADMDKSVINAAFDSTYEFTKEDAVVYVAQAASVKAEPSDDAEEIASIEKYASVHLTGSNGLKYWEVTVGGEIGYIDSALIVRDSAEIEALKEDDIRKEETEAHRSRKRPLSRRLPRPVRSGHRPSRTAAGRNWPSRPGVSTGTAPSSAAAKVPYMVRPAKRHTTISI